MPKRRSRPVEPVHPQEPSETLSDLRQALVRRKKSELVEILMELAQADRRLQRQLRVELQVVPAPDERIAATQRAIVDATAFDRGQMGRNFAYDYAAYEEVRRNLRLLVVSGQLQPAMSLALELMDRGSRQVEMSDEGLMTEDIESGVAVVLEALTRSDLPAPAVLGWITSMLKHDRVGFIARESLESLRSHVQKSQPQEFAVREPPPPEVDGLPGDKHGPHQEDRILRRFCTLTERTRPLHSL